MSIQRVSSYALPSAGWRYDVFLSFRGEDTRKTFTDHLYVALKQKGINVFRDDNELERGRSISPELLKAIEESRLSVIVFSKNYADSTWCLDELVKIVECKNKSDNQQVVFPIFYHVEPTVVRKQTENFQQAFAKHEEAFRDNSEKVLKWRNALTEVANIAGWPLKDENEAKFIEDIVKDISSKLIPTNLEILKELVGIKSHLEKLMQLLDTRSNNVRMIGIYGMGGLGKTTIARVIFELISCDFEGSSFLADVREISEKGGLVTLQKQLLSNLLKLTCDHLWNVYDGVNMIRSRLRSKRVLLVIDDVTNLEQLDNLAGKCDWFGLGSRIIITSRDKHLLMKHGVDEVYKLEELNDDEALHLLCLNAFKTHHPCKEYEHISKRVVEYAGGLPLALKVLGSFLFGRTVEEWESALQRLKRDSANEIWQILQISFDGLRESEKEIFLHIACFFKGCDRDYVTKVLDYCELSPRIGINVLIEKSLITLSNCKTLWMHDLLQQMGHQIVKRQCPEEPGKRNRLWDAADIHRVLIKDKETEVVQAIKLDDFPRKGVHLIANAKAFSKMPNLRLLMIHSNVHLPKGLAYLSNELLLLEWHEFPLKSLPSNIQLKKIIEVNMWSSRIEQIWTGIKHLNNLKFMKLSHSQYLIRTPDLTGVPNLEGLILEGCTRLREIDPSLVVHRKLVLLNLKNCTSLTSLSRKIHMESLRKLVLSGCSKLKKFPEIVESMSCLSELLLDETALESLPLSVELLTGLVLLKLKDCKSLIRLPRTVNGLKSLGTLDLAGCSKLGNVPVQEGHDMRGTAMRQSFRKQNLKTPSVRGCKELPTSTSGFPRRSANPEAPILKSMLGLCCLTTLDLSDCNLGEGAIPIGIGKLLSLKTLNLSKNNFVSLPETIIHLSKLERLQMEYCKSLESLPELPSNIQIIKVQGCTSLESVSDVLKSCQSADLEVNFVKCWKLFANNSVCFSMLEQWLEAESNPNRFTSVFPGSEIPKWFRYQNEGSSITIVRPPNSCYNEKNLVGYAFCVVVHLPKIDYLLPQSLYVDMKGCNKRFVAHSGGYFDQSMSYHICLLYLSNQEVNVSDWNFKADHVELSFTPVLWWSLAPVLKVKSCGVHPVYMDEVEEFNNTAKEWRKSKVWNCYEYDYVFDAESMMDVATTSKIRLTECATEEACSDEELHERY